MDGVINNMDAAPTVLRNIDPNHNHWIGFRLVGGPKSPRDAIGAVLYLKANGIRQRADVFSGGSYASTSDMRPHFGLGLATAVDGVEVHWPSGLVESFSVPAVDTFQTLAEGHGKPAAAGK
jgi:hypothetical protein